MTDSEWKGASWKQEEDYSKETDELLEKVNAEILPVLLRSSNKTVDDITQEIFDLEKKARLGGDTLSTTRLAVEALKMYRTQKLYKEMLEKLDTLIKRRGQMKQVQSAMIAECNTALGNIDDDQRTDMLTQLVHLTEGKIHVELEHARFTVQLAKTIEEKNGSKKEAADMLSDLQVETITNMPRTEKLDIILHQLRLTLELNDLPRVPLVSRKVTYRALGMKDSIALKEVYFRYMIDYFTRQKQFFMVARCEHELYLTSMGVDAKKLGKEAVKEANRMAQACRAIKENKGSASGANDGDDDNADANDHNGSGDDASGLLAQAALLTPEQNDSALMALSNCAMLVMLSETLQVKEIEDQAECCAFSPGSMQTDRSKWLVELEVNQKLEQELSQLHDLVKKFNTSDLIRETVKQSISELCSAHPVLVGLEDRKLELQRRLSEHDMLVVASSFTKVRISRLAELVSLTVEECEAFIMTMVNMKSLHAKIDRIDGVVVFEKKNSPAEEMEAWNGHVERMMQLIDKASHLVVKERMLNSIVAENAARKTRGSVLQVPDE